jgi:hypothetical protein
MLNKKTMSFAALLVLLLFGVFEVGAKPHYIGMQRAREIAARQVSGKIKSAEFEKEHGKMIYSFDIKQPSGKIIEVNIDAVTGAVIGKHSESPADEKREKETDKHKVH